MSVLPSLARVMKVHASHTFVPDDLGRGYPRNMALQYRIFSQQGVDDWRHRSDVGRFCIHSTKQEKKKL